MRHGQTAWNALRRFQGQTDIPLDDEGRAQARALAAHLQKEAISAAFSSDLCRARETAETILTGREVPLILEPRLREMRFGDWEGLDWTEIRERYPQVPEGAWSDPNGYTPTGGERFEEVHERVADVIAGLRERTAPEERVLIVTHAGVLHSFVHVLAPAGVPPLRIRFQTASLTRIRLHGDRAELATLNERPVVSSR